MIPSARLAVLAALALTGFACSRDEPEAAPPLACNGHPELCDRRYDAVAYPGTHDSYSDTDERFLAPDQTHPIARQLEDGIRVLHLEVHVYQGEVSLCHALCELGATRLVDAMKALAAFLKSHPHEVVSLLLERSDPQITADGIGEALVVAGLEPLMHTQAPGAPWPTLGQMIRGGDRVVALLDDPTGSRFPWLLPRWAWTWETPWDNETAADFGRCDADRGTRGNSLYVVDTYLEDRVIPTADDARRVNVEPFLDDRLSYCRAQTATFPNFVMVNFYEVGDLFHVVDVLNGFAEAPPLGAFPPASLDVDGGSPDAG